jgi:hypothetical protein
MPEQLRGTRELVVDLLKSSLNPVYLIAKLGDMF